MVLKIDCMDDGSPLTTLTGTVDQAALQGLMRRLYMIDPASMVGTISYFTLIIFFFILGREIYSLSKAS